MTDQEINLAAFARLMDATLDAIMPAICGAACVKPKPENETEQEGSDDTEN